MELMEILNICQTVAQYAAMLAVSIMFFVKTVKEHKGKTYDEIMEHYYQMGKKKAEKAKKKEQ